MISFFKFIFTILNFIKPNNSTRILWDVISILITAEQLWYTPLISCFPDIEPRTFSLAFQTIPLTIFTFDILFNFITGYYSKGSWIEDKYQVAQHYLKKEFWIDILTLIPIYIVYAYDNIDRQWSLIFMFRLIRIQKMYERTLDHFQLKKANHLSVLSLLILGLKVLFVAHLGACFWHFQSSFQMTMGEDRTWIVYYKLIDENWLVRYVNCFYFIIVTMVTVGYGDMAPQNHIEKVFICFLVLFGCGLFGYCLNKIGSIFQQIFF